MTYLNETIELINNSSSNKWTNYGVTKMFSDNLGNYSDHSLKGYFAEFFIPNNYRNSNNTSVFVEANYITLHSGEKLHTLYVLKISRNKFLSIYNGIEAEKLFKLVRKKIKK